MDRLTLDKVADVLSWWKFHRNLQMMLPPIWHNLQVHQEPPCPPKLWEETLWKVWVLSVFQMFCFNENFTEASKWCSLKTNYLLMYYLDENFTEASLKTRRRDLEVESWQGSKMLLKDASSYLSPSLGSSGSSMSSLTQRRDLEDRWRIWQLIGFLMSDLEETFCA